MLQIAVLGAVEVIRDGHRVPVPTGKPSELLVRLAVEAGLFVRTDRLLEDLWADAVNTRRNTLQSKVATLRRALGEPPLIVSGGGGYKLAVDESEVDALAVLSQAASASRLLAAGDEQGAADLSLSALKMFRGDVLQSVSDGDWVKPHRARLEAARTTLVETQFAARLQLGDAGEVIGELEAEVANSPLQESLWELLITALYRAGRQADALAAYQRVREQLAQDFGLDPGPRLQRLEQQILIHDASLGTPAGAVRPIADDTAAGNLPSMATDLVGRDAEIASLCDLIAGHRLVEIVGPGGVGKTAVAIATGRRFDAGGAWLVRLETAVTAHDVVDALIAAMSLPGGETELFERLKGATGLVILDNCEQVIDAARTLALRFLDSAPGIRVLCTSQLPLDIDGEVLFDLSPLALPDAVELFTRRANARRMSGRPHVDDLVHDLCRSLDGLPLAIELAAARTKTLSIEEITRRLDDRFNVLSDPTSRRPERRRALRSTIRWSYDLLFPDDQRGLWALSTFAGGAPLLAVESLLEALDVPAAAAIDVVGRLASRSLVIVDDEAGSAVRYRLLDSVRAFASEEMAVAELSERAHAAHAAWFANVADSSTQGVRSSGQAEHLALARAERANIDAALAWSVTHDPLLAVRIVNGFGWAWIVLGDSRGAQRILTALDVAGDGASIQDRGNALLLAAWIEASTGDLELAHIHIRAATELADQANDVDLQARCCYYLAYVVSHQGEFREALELTDRSHALYEGLDRKWDQAANWLFAARAAISAGDHGRSVEAIGQVQHWLESVDDPWLHVRGEAVLGELARIEHRFEDAVHYLARAAETSRIRGFVQTEAYQVSSLGRAQCQSGDYDTGAVTLQVAVDKAEATGDVRLAALARVHLGRVLRALREGERARGVLESANAWHRAAGGGEQAALGDCLLAAMDAVDGVAGAQERLGATLEDAQRTDDAPVEVFALDALARLAADRGDIAVARELSERADERFLAASHFITDFDRVDAHAVRQIA